MPTPYQTLCAKYRNQRKLYFENRWTCADFVNRVWKDFASFIGLPLDGVKILPPDEEVNEKTTYTSFGAIKLEDDSCWHFQLAITVEEAPNAWPKSVVIAEVWVRIAGNFLIAKIAGSGKSYQRFPLDGKFVSKKANLRPFTNRIVKVMDHLLDETKRFLDKGKEEYEQFGPQNR